MEGFPMKVASICVLLFALSACTTTTPTTGPHATVQMRDGSSVSGMVLSSSADEVKITGDDNVTRTIPMTQVRSIDYGDASATAAAPGAAPARSSSAPTAAGGAPRPAAPRPVRPPLPHPTSDDITS